MVHKVRTRSQSDKQCPVCEARQTDVFFEANQLPLHVDIVWPDHEDAQSVPKGDIKLAYCDQCGHIFNMAFDPDLVKYNDWYENSLHLNSRFQSPIKPVADRLVEQYGVQNKEVIQIGSMSMQGDFLELLCEIGENRGIGFDPGYPDDPVNSSTRQHVTFMQDISSDQYGRYQADLICCRQVLEQIYKPHDFVNMLRRAIGDRYDTIGYFEVQNSIQMLSEFSIWGVLYDQYSYFTRPSLAYLFINNGFTLLNIEEIFGDKHISIDVKPSVETSEGPWLPDRIEMDSLKQSVANFRFDYDEKTTYWSGKLSELKSTDKKVVVWGAGPKGVTFLNALKVRDEILHVVDTNPQKRDMHIAGSGHRIVSPVVLRNLRPDVIIVMDATNEVEIRQWVTAMDLAPELLFL